MILWPGTTEYEKKARELPLSPATAHTLLVTKTRAHPDRFFDRNPIFLVDDEYFFAEPRKTEIRLQGFYLNARTGVIHYRTSNKTVKPRAKAIPEDAYESSIIVE